MQGYLNMNLCPSCNGGHKQWPQVKSGKHHWYYCKVCELGWKFPYVGEWEEENSEIQNTYGTYEPQGNLFRLVAEEKARWVLPHLRAGMDYLEFGPGLGNVLLALKSECSESRFFAVEPNPKFAVKLKTQNVEVLQSLNPSDLENFCRQNFASKPVLVYLDNVLEHVPFPKKFLLHLESLLPFGSLLLGEVPNETGLWWRASLQDFLRGSTKPPTFPGHINLFRKGSLRSVLNCPSATSIKIWGFGLRNPGQIQYLSQQHSVPQKVLWVLQFLRLFPLDLLFGLAYWLRFEVRLGTIPTE
jgi:hypothetical protein